MDVERIQKINKLALDLMRQGLASDRDDAVVQAEKIFRAKDGEYSSIRDRMQGGPEPLQASPASLALTPNTQQAVASADLHPEKVKDILQQNSQFLVKKIAEFQEQMQAMRKELDMLKQQRAVSAPQHTVVSNAPPKLGEIPAHNPDIQRGQGGQANANNHPRSGNYKVEEVSIEKFFYMGNKR
jgi:hypothetical protein